MIFTARQLQEKCQEQRCDLYTTFVDLTNAFNTVSRDGLWKILAMYGCPEKFISIARQFHDGMRACVQDNGNTSEAFVITNSGVKQGCVLTPILFCLIFLAMLQDAFHHSEDRIHIIYLTERKPHNQHHLKAITKVKQAVIRNFLFASDCALNTNMSVTCRTAWTDSPQLVTISVSPLAQKTEVMFQPAPGKPYLKPCITVNDTVPNDVEKFTYLGSTISRHANIDEKVTCRIAKASSAFGRLQFNIWDRRGISLTTKMKMY